MQFKFAVLAAFTAITSTSAFADTLLLSNAIVTGGPGAVQVGGCCTGPRRKQHSCFKPIRNHIRIRHFNRRRVWAGFVYGEHISLSIGVHQFASRE